MKSVYVRCLHTLSRCSAIIIALWAATACLIGTATAADVRYPQTGPVAFMLHLPDKWSSKLDDSGNMLVISPDHSSAMSLTVVTEDATAQKQTPDQFANASLAVAKAEPFNKHEAGSIAGFAADTYYSRMVNPSNVKIVVKMNLIKPVHGYIVSESILTITNITSAQQAALATALKGITLTGVIAEPTSAAAPLDRTRAKAPLNPARTEAPSTPTRAETPSNPARIEVPLKSVGGTFVVPVFINGAITLNFIVDSGAADVSVPSDVVGTLIRAGTIEKSDFTGKQTYVLADGSVSPSNTFIIRSLKVGDVIIENVKGSVSPAAGSLLLGQSFLQRFKSWSMDNNKHVLVLEN